MTENYSDKSWSAFENSGRITDYLSYKGIYVQPVSSLKGEAAYADNDSGRGNSCNGSEGK